MNLRPRSERHRRRQVGVGATLIVASFLTAYASSEVGSVQASAAESGATEPAAPASAEASPESTATSAVSSSTGAPTTAPPAADAPATEAPATEVKATEVKATEVKAAETQASATPAPSVLPAKPTEDEDDDSGAMITARAAAVPVAVAVATTPGATSSATPTPCVTTAPVTAGTMVWGMKDSFRKYIVGPIAKGNITVSDGATQAASNGPFTFGGGTGTASSGAFTGSYKGKVTMKGHETPPGSGTFDLNMTLSNPKITIAGGTGVLAVDAVDSDGAALPGLKFVNLVLTGKAPTVGGTTVTYTGIPTTMHKDAVALFGSDEGSFYSKDEPFEPVTFSLSTSATPSTANPCVTSRANSTSTPRATSSSSATSTSSRTSTPTPDTGDLPATGANTGTGTMILLASGLLASGTVMLSFSVPVKPGRYRRQ